mmetsp:Transcript_18591/g.26165  ORF Transcript_18591/g.26165 Transcript_18591/m.26165 type:complete len:91 (-) Transcript_18591:1692-1964(-)
MGWTHQIPPRLDPCLKLCILFLKYVRYDSGAFTICFMSFVLAVSLSSPSINDFVRKPETFSLGNKTENIYKTVTIRLLHEYSRYVTTFRE